MQQVVSVFLIGSVLVGVFLGRRVEKARSSHTYYKRIKNQLPEMRKTNWANVRGAVGAVMLVALIMTFVIIIGFTALE